MKNKLEEFVKNNRRAFDDQELPAGIWDKIEKELDRKQPKKSVRMYSWMGAAACVTIVFGLIWMYSAKTSSHTVDIASINPVYAQKEVRFISQIEEKRDSLELLASSDPNLYQQFSTDLVTLDAEYEKLKKDLKTTPNQLSIVKAMVKNREMQLQILNQQLGVINQINQYKKENTL